MGTSWFKHNLFNLFVYEDEYKTKYIFTQGQKFCTDETNSRFAHIKVSEIISNKHGQTFYFGG